MKAILTTLLFTAFLSNLIAQKQYNYAILEGDEYYDRFTLHINYTQTVTRLNKDSLKRMGFHNLMITRIKKMEKNGWELFETDSKIKYVNERPLGYIHFYYFRKEEDMN